MYIEEKMLKKLIISSLLFSTSVIAGGNWFYSNEIVDGVKSYNVYGIDNKLENALSISCDDELKDPIVTIQVNKKLLNKESSIVSYTFDNKEKIRTDAYYLESNAWSNSDIIGKTVFSQIIDDLKKSKLVTIGFVRKNGESDFFEVNLAGSSEAINNLKGRCNLI